MKEFSYERPESLDEALQVLATSGSEVEILAGGTDLVIAMRDRSSQPKVVVDLKRIVEFYPSLVWDGDTVTLSATATMSEVVGDEGINTHFPALVEAAVVVGSIQIRNRATLLGNICNGSPAADTAPPLLAYDAIIVVAGPEGTRRVAIDDFIVGPGRTDLQDGEIAIALELTVPSRRLGGAYERMTRRRGTDLASVTLCATVDDVGVTRVAYGSVGPRAWLKTDQTGVLADPAASREAKAAVFEEIFADASPSVRSMRASPDYRRAMLRVLGARAVVRAVERLQELQGVS
ncbi:MAG: xanthine dehydrogenase family protein subunit M [Acidimicrobiia bacterium]|nr:xanthine dehydrogenase family protein subunit M [Acidimicrobiia bacterium]